MFPFINQTGIIKTGSFPWESGPFLIGNENSNTGSPRKGIFFYYLITPSKVIHVSNLQNYKQETLSREKIKQNYNQSTPLLD